MHPIQKKLIELTKKYNLGAMSLREIAKLIGEKTYPQKIKHHLQKLQDKNVIVWDKANKIIKLVKSFYDNATNLISIPILGEANCGPAEIFAEQNWLGRLQLSPSMLETTKKKNIFAIKATGISMNKAQIGNKIKQNINEGDYVLVDSDDTAPENNNYVLSIINGCANIKKYVEDKKNNRVALISESTRDFPPIFIHEEDANDFSINGKIFQVIKKI